MTLKPLVLTALLLLAACHQPVADDASLFITPQQYAPFGIEAPFDSSPYENLTKTWYPDLSTKIRYDYHPPENTPGISILTQELTVSQIPFEAAVTTPMTSLLRKTRLQTAGFSIEETDEYHYNAETHTYQVLSRDGVVIGNIVQASLGKAAYYAIIFGAYITGPDVWKAIFDEKFAAIASHDWPLLPDLGTKSPKGSGP